MPVQTGVAPGPNAQALEELRRKEAEDAAAAAAEEKQKQEEARKKAYSIVA